MTSVTDGLKKKKSNSFTSALPSIFPSVSSIIWISTNSLFVFSFKDTKSNKYLGSFSSDTLIFFTN